ncbi:MAG TPA: DUF2269 family protein [Gaiellaceae bacterium]|nr:DUF2269 family protein [Gaiellaceae bacterium]
MTSYELWLFLHITGTVVWVGGAVTAQLFGFLAQRSKDPARNAAFGRDVYWVVTRLFMPTSVIVLVTGFALMGDGGWSWGEPFIWLGLVLWVVVAGLAFGYVTPALGRVGRQIAAEGPSPELLARTNRLVVSARVLILVLVIIVFLMVVKPGT